MWIFLLIHKLDMVTNSVSEPYGVAALPKTKFQKEAKNLKKTAWLPKVRAARNDAFYGTEQWVAQQEKKFSEIVVVDRGPSQQEVRDRSASYDLAVRKKNAGMP